MAQLGDILLIVMASSCKYFNFNVCNFLCLKMILELGEHPKEGGN